jgi:hypothetical protein
LDEHVVLNILNLFIDLPKQFPACLKLIRAFWPRLTLDQLPAVHWPVQPLEYQHLHGLLNICWLSILGWLPRHVVYRYHFSGRQDAPYLVTHIQLAEELSKPRAAQLNSTSAVADALCPICFDQRMCLHDLLTMWVSQGLRLCHQHHEVFVLIIGLNLNKHLENRHQAQILDLTRVHHPWLGKRLDHLCGDALAALHLVDLLAEDMSCLLPRAQYELGWNETTPLAHRHDRSHQGDEDACFKNMILWNQAQHGIKLIDQNLLTKEELVQVWCKFWILFLQLHDPCEILKQIKHLLRNIEIELMLCKYAQVLVNLVWISVPILDQIKVGRRWACVGNFQVKKYNFWAFEYQELMHLVALRLYQLDVVDFAECERFLALSTEESLKEELAVRDDGLVQECLRPYLDEGAITFTEAHEIVVRCRDHEDSSLLIQGDGEYVSPSRWSQKLVIHLPPQIDLLLAAPQVKHHDFKAAS